MEVIEIVDSYQYLKIPDIIAQDKKLTPLSKLIYGKILVLTHNDGKCWASNQFFSNFFHVNIRTIQNAISILYDQGYILINPDDNNRHQRKRHIYINYDKL